MTPYRDDPKPLKVRGDTDTGSFAKSLRLTIDENAGRATVRAMGAQAVNQMCKGLINAQRDLAAQGKKLSYVFAYVTFAEEDARSGELIELTAIQATCTVADL